MKKVHSILSYVESLPIFTEIKQVNAHSIQVWWGLMGINAWNTFKVEHPYIVRKGELTFHAEKIACYKLYQQIKVYVLALAWQTTLKTVALTRNQMISLSIASSDCRVHVILSYPPDIGWAL